MQAYTVTEVNYLVKNALAQESELQSISVQGEISNFKKAASGHWYFTIKDKDAAIDCVCFVREAMTIVFSPEDGMMVTVTARLDVYIKTGRYQLYVTNLTPSGIGSITLAVEQLKRKLAQEGLFDQTLKKKLPSFPKRIAVVTSATGAAVRDVCVVAKRRAPMVDLVIVPTTVQGVGAVSDIRTALELANKVHGVEVIMLVRGGGSFEDLQVFNDQDLARAIRSSKIPVVTGIGHEIDTTIADLASDLRGATPSAATEVVIPMAKFLRQQLASKRQRAERFLLDLVRRNKTWHEQLERRLLLVSPLEKVAGERNQLRYSIRRLIFAQRENVTARKSFVTQRKALLSGLSPLKILERGYSITTSQETNRPITMGTEVLSGQLLKTILAHGTITSRAILVDEQLLVPTESG